MAASTLTPFIGLIALSMIPNSPANMWTKWGMYLITVPYVLALFLAWTLIPSNVAGRTKKTIISSATFLGYCVGNMAGSQIFKEADAPGYGELITNSRHGRGTRTDFFSYSSWHNWCRRCVGFGVLAYCLLEGILCVAEPPAR
jgi:hypothetical protein